MEHVFAMSYRVCLPIPKYHSHATHTHTPINAGARDVLVYRIRMQCADPKNRELFLAVAARAFGKGMENACALSFVWLTTRIRKTRMASRPTTRSPRIAGIAGAVPGHLAQGFLLKRRNGSRLFVARHAAPAHDRLDAVPHRRPLQLRLCTVHRRAVRPGEALAAAAAPGASATSGASAPNGGFPTRPKKAELALELTTNMAAATVDTSRIL